MRGVLSSILGVFLVSAISMAFPVAAQQPGLGINNTASLRLEPAWPEPNQTVAVSLDAYAFDLVGSTIAWFISGEVQQSFTDQRDITITTGDLGSELRVEANIKLRDGQIIRASSIVAPSEVDMIIEADTQTHPQYHARALGSIGSDIKIIAIPHTNSALSAEQLTYIWKLNNRTLFGGSARGRNVINLTMPAARESFLTVEVLNNDGVTLARKTIILSPHDVEVEIYENNPLRGLRTSAVGKEFLQLSTETNYQAIPYFANTDTSNFLQEWSINGSVVDNQSTDPRSLTIRQVFTGEPIRVGYAIRNLQEFLQGGETEFELSFGQ